VGLLILGAIFGEDKSDKTADETTSVTVTQTAPPVKTTTTPESLGTIADARAAVNEDDYAAAIAIATALGAKEADSIRRRISNRIARRVFSALRAGNRGRARTLLIKADRYPRTQQVRRARASYKAAKAQAAQRARERRQVVADRRRAREQAEQAEQAAPPPPPPDSPQAPSGGTCADTPMTNFAVPPGDSRDRDGDGIACES